MDGLPARAQRAAIGPAQIVFVAFGCAAIGLVAFLSGTVPAAGAAAGPTLSRAELLAFMWGTPFTGTAVLAGTMLLLTVALAGAVALQWARTPACIALATFTLCAGLAGGWALLTPPLQAPDEADHFLGFFGMKDTGLTARPDVLAWANRMHFERLKFRRGEGFNGAHVAAPQSGPWAWHIAAVDVQSRSPLTYRVWRALAREFADSGFSAGIWLLVLRAANALALSAAISLAGFAVARFGQSRGNGAGQAASVAFTTVLLLIPTFCLLAVHASNYGSLLAGLVILFAGLHLGLQGPVSQPREEMLIGLLVGGGIGISMLSTRSATPVVSMLAFLLVARNLFEQVPLRRTAAFWLATAAAFFAALQLPDEHYRTRLVVGFGEIRGRMGAGESAPSFLQLEGLLALLLLALLAFEALIQRAQAKIGEHRLAKRNLRAFIAASATMSACLLVAANVSPGHLANNETRTPLLGFDYVRPVVVRFLDQVFPLSRPDFFLSTSFWGGFGWLDRLLPEPVVFVLKMIPLAGLVACAIPAARSAGERPAFLKMSVFFFAALFLVAVNAYLTTRLDVVINVQGRYLIIPYLLLLLPAMSTVRDEFRRHAGLPAFAIAGLLLAHPILWCWLLGGYLF